MSDVVGQQALGRQFEVICGVADLCGAESRLFLRIMSASGQDNEVEDLGK